MAMQRKAIALISGGLDSMLAVKAVQKQGIIVEGVNFYTGFCVEGHTHAIRKKDKEKQKRNNALWVAEQLGIRMNIVDISEEYKKIVLNPQHGYGANLNPCLDCKIFMVDKARAMLNKAREIADDKGFDFIITGEVIGQRPKSQRKETMPLIARESGAAVICVSHLRMPDGSYRVVFSPIQESFGEHPEQDAKVWNGFIEATVREQPDQYLWLHKRFKSRPEGAAAIY